MKWREITLKIGRPTVVDEEVDGRLVVRIPILPVPDEHWVRFFQQAPDVPGASASDRGSRRLDRDYPTATGLSSRITWNTSSIASTSPMPSGQRTIAPRLERAHADALRAKEAQEAQKQRVFRAQEELDRLFRDGGRPQP